MTSRKKIATGVIAGVFAVLILMLAAVLIAPKLLDTRSVKDEILKHVQKELGAKVDFKHLSLDLFPHPHIIFDQVTLSIPPGVRGKAVSVRVYPEILPLFLGKVQISSLRVDSAELDYTLTKKPVTEKQAVVSFSLDKLGKKVQSIVSALPEFKIPDLDYHVINSRMNLFDGGRKILALSSVNSHMEGPASGRKITLNCKSDLWQSIAMSGLLNTTTFKGSGRIQFTQFRPQGLAAGTLADSAFQVTDASADLTIDFKTEGAGKLQAEAHGAGSHLKLQYAKKELNIKNPRIKAALLVDKDTVTLSLSELALDDPRLNVTGKLAWKDMQGKTGSRKSGSEKQLSLDMDIDADTVDLFPLIEAMENISAHNGGEKNSESQSFPIQGNIRFKADRFKIGKFTWNPLHADISLNNDTADITLKEAVICGISTPGTLKVSLPDIEFDLEAVAKDQELSPAKTCLVGETFKADGTYNLKGRFQGRGKAEDLLKTATGQVEFTAADGHIYHDILLVNLLTFLNTLEVLTGKVDVKDMGSKGFGYHSFRLKIKMQDGKLRYDEAVLHGRPMTVTAAGQHDLQNGRLDLTLLVAPLVTLDNIFKHIPLIGGVLDTLDTIPLSANGTLDTIHFTPLAPSAIGYELKEMMKNTVERPINLIHGGKTSE